MSLGINQAMTKQQWLAAREKNNQHILNHEKQHLAAAGKYADGGIHMDYNSQGWATGGHVKIKMPALNKANPKETIQHAEAVKKAALAPGDPSEQDYKVAAQASQTLFKAQQLLANGSPQQSGKNHATNPAMAGKKLNFEA